MKDQERSTEFRIQGNEFYKKGLDKKALQKYYQAFDIAVHNSTPYFKAMCNIAVTLVNLDFPEYAEAHLKRLLQTKSKLGQSNQIDILSKKLRKYPKNTKKKLFVPPVQKLYKGRNEFYPQLSSLVKVDYNNDRGRHLVACEDIPAGSVVGLEIPTLLVTTRCSTNCSYCCRILPLSYLPCEACDARFCDEKCREEGEYFHWLICHTNYIPDHSAIDLAVRTVMNFTRHELEKCFVSPPIRANVTIPHDGASFSSILCLQYHDFSNHDEAIFKAVDEIMQCSKFLKKMGYAECDRNYLKQFLVNSLRSVVGRIELNAHLVYHEPCEWILGKHLGSRMLIDAGIRLEHSFSTKKIELLNNSENIGDVVAVCLLPVASIANHSCVPNLATSFGDADERCIVIRTSRNVFAGEELLHNYGPILGIHTYEERQTRLQNDFKFLCKCEACIMGGSHPVDRRLSCRICCLCHTDFIPLNQSDFRCITCSRDNNKEIQITYRNLQRKLAEVDAALEFKDWDWNAKDAHEKAFQVFKSALDIYYGGHRKLEYFVVEACATAARAGHYKFTESYIHFLYEVRKLIFDGRYCSFLANAYLLLAIFGIMQMKVDPEMRNKVQLRDIKKNIDLARSVFNKLYGDGSVRDYELDLLLEVVTKLANSDLKSWP